MKLKDSIINLHFQRRNDDRKLRQVELNSTNMVRRALHICTFVYITIVLYFCGGRASVYCAPAGALATR